MKLTQDKLLSALAQSRNQSYDTASSMPASYYGSDEFTQLELEQLFRKKWMCVGRVEEIPRSGDYFVTDITGESILVVRGNDLKVRTLSNVCRHRGMLIAAGAGNAKQFVCPYHAWTYDIQGTLAGSPLVKRPECAAGTIQLHDFACEVWEGFIYVCLDNDTPPLAPQLAGLDKIIKHYHMAEMRHVYSNEQVWATNWKCLAENFMEGYHLSHVHRETLHSITPTRLCKHFAPGEGYIGYYSAYPANAAQRGTGHSDLTDEEKLQSVMFSVMPAHVAGVAAHSVFYVCIQPVDAHHVRAKLGVAVYDDDNNTQHSDEIVEFFERIMSEDKIQLERLQKGLRSRHYQPGVLSGKDYEGTVFDFYRYMDRALNT